MNEYTKSEIEFAKKYISGSYTDVQFNYLIVQNKFDKQKIENLIDNIRTTEPFYIFCKLLIILMMFHFLSCFLYSIFMMNN